MAADPLIFMTCLLLAGTGCRCPPPPGDPGVAASGIIAGRSRQARRPAPGTARRERRALARLHSRPESLTWRPGERICATVRHRFGSATARRHEEGRFRVAHRFPALLAAPAPSRGRLWLTGARLHDGTGGPVTAAQGRAPQEARQAMRYGAFRGPRLLTCGKIISATASGGRFYGDMYREADGPDEMRRAVREQIRAGADFIKVMTTGARSNELEDPDPLQLTEAERAAVADEARRRGFRVSAHAEGLNGCAAAVRHGADTIEHGMYLHQRPDLLDAMAA